MVLQLHGSTVFTWCFSVIIQYGYRQTDRATTRGPIGPKKLNYPNITKKNNTWTPWLTKQKLIKSTCFTNMLKGLASKILTIFCLPGVNEFCFSLNHKLIRHFSWTNCACTGLGCSKLQGGSDWIVFLARIKFLAIHKLTSGPCCNQTRQKPQADTHFVSIIQHLKHWDSVYSLFAANLAHLCWEREACYVQTIRTRGRDKLSQKSSFEFKHLYKIFTKHGFAGPLHFPYCRRKYKHAKRSPPKDLTSRIKICINAQNRFGLFPFTLCIFITWILRNPPLFFAHWRAD